MGKKDIHETAQMEFDALEQLSTPLVYSNYFKMPMPSPRPIVPLRIHQRQSTAASKTARQNRQTSSIPSNNTSATNQSAIDRQKSDAETIKEKHTDTANADGCEATKRSESVTFTNDKPVPLPQSTGNNESNLKSQQTSMSRADTSAEKNNSPFDGNDAANKSTEEMQLKSNSKKSVRFTVPATTPNISSTGIGSVTSNDAETSYSSTRQHDSDGNLKQNSISVSNDSHPNVFFEASKSSSTFALNAASTEASHKQSLLTETSSTNANGASSANKAMSNKEVSKVVEKPKVCPVCEGDLDDMDHTSCQEDDTATVAAAEDVSDNVSAPSTFSWNSSLTNSSAATTTDSAHVPSSTAFSFDSVSFSTTNFFASSKPSTITATSSQSGGSPSTDSTTVTTNTAPSQSATASAFSFGSPAPGSVSAFSTTGFSSTASADADSASKPAAFSFTNAASSSSDFAFHYSAPAASISVSSFAAPPNTALSFGSSTSTFAPVSTTSTNVGFGSTGSNSMFGSSTLTTNNYAFGNVNHTTATFGDTVSAFANSSADGFTTSSTSAFHAAPLNTVSAFSSSSDSFNSGSNSAFKSSMIASGLKSTPNSMFSFGEAQNTQTQPQFSFSGGSQQSFATPASQPAFAFQSAFQSTSSFGAPSVFNQQQPQEHSAFGNPSSLSFGAQPMQPFGVQQQPQPFNGQQSYGAQAAPLFGTSQPMQAFGAQPPVQSVNAQSISAANSDFSLNPGSFSAGTRRPIVKAKRRK